MTEITAGAAVSREATRHIAASLDPEALFLEYANQIVPSLTTGCSIFFAGEGELPFCQRFDHPRGFSRNLGLHDLILDLLDETARTSRTVRRRGIKLCLVSVPLFWNERMNGALIVARDTEIDDAELALFEDHAVTLSVSLRNCFLYRDAKLAIRAREDFISVASHELKTPLTTITLSHGLVKRMLKDARLGAIEKQTLMTLTDSIDDQLKGLSRLMGTLLDPSKLPGGHCALERREVDLGALVLKIARRFEPEALLAGSTLSVRARSIYVTCDPLRIEQALSNLIANAIKYGNAKPIDVELETECSYALISVRDHGIGVAREDRQRIFERYQRARNCGNVAGSGLGLYIARQLVEAHQGTITLWSVPHEGSTFEVRLPLPLRVK